VTRKRGFTQAPFRASTARTIAESLEELEEKLKEVLELCLEEIMEGALIARLP
jgi:hypothetical protein